MGRGTLLRLGAGFEFGWGRVVWRVGLGLGAGLGGWGVGWAGSWSLGAGWGLGGWGQTMERLEFGFEMIAGFGFESDGLGGSTQAMTNNFYLFLS